MGQSKLHEQLEKQSRTLGDEQLYVVYHPSNTSSWERAEFRGENYDESHSYNHRTIRNCEVVLEYDDESKRINYELAMRASRKLCSDNKAHSVWTSGNKSTHIHSFWNFSDAENVRYLKRLLLKKYGNVKHRGSWYEPDMALASPNHLIRAEYGVHEKTQQCKSFVDQTAHYPRLNSVPKDVWDNYDSSKDDCNNFDDEELVESVSQSKAFKWLLDPENIKEVGDGRKRGVFIIGNILYQATEYSEEDVINFCKEWYEAAGGTDYKRSNIRRGLEANFRKGGYTPGYLYLNDYLSDLGREDLLD